VILEAENQRHLKEIVELADEHKVHTKAVRDAGRTEVTAGTITSLAIGPDNAEKINKITGDLKTLK
jgi:PTH2 family peptidyl-tRNA hydrolase